MVVFTALLDSFSRCLGTNHLDTQVHSPNDKADISKPAERLSARAIALNSNADANDNISQDQKHSAVNANIDLPDLGSDLHHHSMHKRSQSASSFASESSSDDRQQAQTLSKAKLRASSSSISRNRRTSVLSKSSSSLSHKASLEKARTRSNKRKLDIFRNVEQPSAFSKFLGGGSQVGGFTGGAMLCFANPIFDSTDDDMRILRRRENIDDAAADEETITSTLYFDAKYEHIVEDRQPMPLYRDYLVVQNNSSDEIMQMYQSGENKRIRSIYRGHPPPPPNVSSTSMVDATSSDEETDEEDDHSEHDNLAKTFFSEEDCNNVTFDMVGDTSPSSCLTIPSPPTCGPRKKLVEHHSANMPDLKLLSRSSNSLTATLTPIGSSRSTSASLSPKPNGHKVYSDYDPQHHHHPQHQVQQIDNDVH